MDKTAPQNVFHFCPRCGSQLFSEDRKYFFRCKGCKFELFINASTTVVLLLQDQKERILLTRRARDPHKGTLDLPGGFVDPLETVEQAAIREIKEELNLELTDLQYLTSTPTKYSYGGLTYYTLDLAFRGKVKSFSSIQAQDDVEEFIFFNLNEIDFNDFGFESVKTILKTFLGC